MILNDHRRIQQQIRVKLFQKETENIAGDEYPGHDQRKTGNRVFPDLTLHFAKKVHLS